MENKVVYLKLKDKSTGKGFRIAKKYFNPESVEEFKKDSLRNSVKMAIRNGQLAYATKVEFEAWQAKLAAATKQGAALREARSQSKKRLQAINSGKDLAEKAKAEVKAEADTKISAAAAKLIEENNLNAAQIEGTGRDGSITKGDVVSHLEGLKPAEDSE